MDDKLISKKELLEKYNISYGALYRWKRMGLIPDDWFIKKSSVTGQATYFPQKLVCERIELIQNMKEDVLLEELAKKLSGEENADDMMVISTEYGEKTYYLKDISSVKVINKKGEKTDITENIKGMFKAEENKRGGFFSRIFK